MQKINYTEKIKIQEPIQELLLINIEEKLSKIEENDCTKITGNIEISGEVKTIEGKASFSHPIEVNILLDNEQISSEVKAYVDDFEYKIENDSIFINLIIKVEGLKEIDAYFPPQENQEDTQINDDEIDYVIETLTSNEREAQEISEPIIEEIQEEQAPVITTKYSLLNQIFKNKCIHKETSFFYHVAKTETEYEEIAKRYSLDASYLKQINNGEKIYPGKLILIQNNQ